MSSANSLRSPRSRPVPEQRLAPLPVMHPPQCPIAGGHGPLHGASSPLPAGLRASASRRTTSQDPGRRRRCSKVPRPPARNQPRRCAFDATRSAQVLQETQAPRFVCGGDGAHALCEAPAAAAPVVIVSRHVARAIVHLSPGHLPSRGRPASRCADAARARPRSRISRRCRAACSVRSMQLLPGGLGGRSCAAPLKLHCVAARVFKTA